MREKEK
jgi:NIMA (never in mitosis gene a)-related kinase 1/4/5